MSIVYLTSDWHLGHSNQIKWRKEFNSVDEIYGLLFDSYTKMVKKKDTCWFLGDMILGDKEYWLKELKALPGDKRLILGNHCTDRDTMTTIEELTSVFTQIHSLHKYKSAWLSHAPLHESELRGKMNIHGHTHYACIEDKRYVNVCPEQTGYAPIKFQDIVERISK